MKQFLVALALGALSSGPGPAGCDYARTRLLRFSGDGQKQRLRVETAGSTCLTAKMRVTLWDTSGRELYRFEGALAPVVDAQTESEGRSAGYSLVDLILKEAVASDAGSLPSWPIGSMEGPDSVGPPAVDRAIYEDARRRKAPLICHSTGFTTSRCLVWSKALRKPLVLLEGGV